MLQHLLPGADQQQPGVEPTKPRQAPEKKSAGKSLDWVKEVKKALDSKLDGIFLPGELIQARMTGFPWWPGIVRSFNPRTRRYQILFFGSNETERAWMKPKDVEVYDFEKESAAGVKVPTKLKARLGVAQSWAQYCRSWTKEQTYNYFVRKEHP